MGIGIKYDDGSGSLKPLASYKGMASPWNTSTKTLFGTPPIKKPSLVERMRARRQAEESKFSKSDLDRTDPRRSGKVIGTPKTHDLDADTASRGSGSHDPWERSYMTGLHFEKEAPTGRTIVWGYLRSDKFTGEGRAFETTGETKVPVYSFFEAEGDAPAPFDIEEGEDGTRKVVRCTFYWGKERVDIPDYDLSDGAEAVYLVGKRSEDGELQFFLATEPPEAEGAVSYQIYAFTDDEVSCDYRTTFLSLVVMKAVEGSGLAVNNDEIDIDGREEDDEFGIRTLVLKGRKEEEDKAVKFLGTVDFEIPKDGVGVNTLNDRKDDIDIIGGRSISVKTNGQTIIVGYEEGKEPDDDPNAEKPDPCDHPGNTSSNGEDDEGGGGGVGGGGVHVDPGETDNQGGTGCCGSGTTGGSGSGSSSPESGSPGKKVDDVPGGKPAEGIPTDGAPSGGPDGQSSSSKGREIEPGSMEETMSRSKTPIYKGSHTALTDAKKMNTSPFAQDQNWKGGIGNTGREKTPIYRNTHTALTDAKKMNTSPFAQDQNWKGGIGFR